MCKSIYCPKDYPSYKPGVISPEEEDNQYHFCDVLLNAQIYFHKIKLRQSYLHTLFSFLFLYSSYIINPCFLQLWVIYNC